MQTELVLVQEVLALLPQRRGEQVAVVREEPRRFGCPRRAALDGGSMLLRGERGEGGEVRRSSRVPKREDDEDGYDGDDDYLPMLDPLAWSVRYEACPRGVCVTRGLRAALCDPD